MDESKENVQDQAQDNNMYIDKLNELRKTTVSKEDYDKLVSENRKMVDLLTERKAEEDKPKVPEGLSDEQLKKLSMRLFKEELSNLEYAKIALAIRDEKLRRCEQDIFLRAGHNVVHDANEIAAANKVAEVFKECIDASEGDSSIFTAELMRRTIDTSPIVRR